MTKKGMSLSDGREATGEGHANRGKPYQSLGARGLKQHFMNCAGDSLVPAGRILRREGLSASGKIRRPRLLGLIGWDKEVWKPLLRF